MNVDKVFEGLEALHQKEKKIRKDKEGLSKRRLGRITGSQVSRIRFLEKKAASNRKNELLKWLKDEGHLSKLGNICMKYGKEDYEKLTIAQIREVYDDLQGSFEMSAGTETYLDELLAEIGNRKSKEEMFSNATVWGSSKEPLSLAMYKKRMGKKHPNWVFAENEFLLSDFSVLVGATPDMNIYDFSKSKKPIRLIENKAPWNSGNHYRVLRTKEVDPRYYGASQLACEMLCAGPQCKYIDFISYDDRATNKDWVQVIVSVSRAKMMPHIKQLKKNLSMFIEIYKKTAKEVLGVNVVEFVKKIDKNEK